MTDYTYLLKTENEDKELEYFWMSLKSCFKTHMTRKQLLHLEKISNQFNHLQYKKKYNAIKFGIMDYLQNEFTKIGWHIIYTIDYTMASHIYSNIKRWNKMYDTVVNYNGKMIRYMYILNIFSKKQSKLKSDIYVKILDLIKKVGYYEIKDNGGKADEISYDLLDIAIENKIETVVDQLRNIYDISEYFDVDISLISTKKIFRHLIKDQV